MTNIFDQMASEDPSEPLEAEPQTADPPPELEAIEESVGRTSAEIRTAVQELLRHGFVEESSRQDLFRRTVIHQQAISGALEPLDLALRIDTHRGVAFLTVAPSQSETQERIEAESDEDAWSHPLVRKQRLTLDQSLLVAILRQVFVMHEQEFGVGQSQAKMSVDELLPTFLTYFGESGSDSRDENRLLQLLDQLKAYGIVSEVDKKHEIAIRPLIAHLASPESLTGLLTVLRERVQAADQPASSTEPEISTENGEFE
jgi:hypothetical protein